MKILIKELENGEIISENLFLSFKEAAKEIGVRSSTIYNTLKKSNPIYHKKSEGRIFFIREKKDEKLCVIDGEEIQSFHEIKERFGISPTIFLNQISKKKNNFLDRNEISHSVSSFSPELEKIIDSEKKKQEMNQKILSHLKECGIKTSYDVFSKKKINVSKKIMGALRVNNTDLLGMDPNSLVAISKK